MKNLIAFASFFLLFSGLVAQNSLVENVPFTNIGPSIMSGRIVDIDINLVGCGIQITMELHLNRLPKILPLKIWEMLQ